MLGERVLRSQLLIDIYPQTRPVVAPEHAIAHLRRAREDLPGYVGEQVKFLDAEVGARQVQVQICGVTDRRDVTRTVPRRANTEEFTECGQFASHRESTDRRDMDPDVVDQPFLDQRLPFSLIDKEFTHRDRDRRLLSQLREPANVFGSERILQEEESELLQLPGQSDCLDG